MPMLARNADGDLLLFIHEGAGDLFCDFGHLTYRDGDYLLLPRGTMWRLEPAAPTTVAADRGDQFALQAAGARACWARMPSSIRPRWKRPGWTTPSRRSATANGRCRSSAAPPITTITYPFNPLDAIGWKGNLAPVKLNWRDIRPVTSHRYHLPPSVHATFVADRFVVCTFVPRPIESDPGALKVPFFHSNDDFDEVIFYHAGDFFSRDNIEPGMVTFHPAGFTHGPHPKAFAAGAKAAKTMTDEVAVMIDARDALDMGEAATATGSHGLCRQLEAEMKFASLKGGRDGAAGGGVARPDPRRRQSPASPPCRPRWMTGHQAAPLLEALPRPECGRRSGLRLRPEDCASPLPRAYQWADGSAYVIHVELVRKARGAELPASFWTDPLMYQGGSDSFLGPWIDILAGDEAWGIDLEGEVAVITGDVPYGCTRGRGAQHIRLVMLVQRRLAAQPDPGRTGQGLRLLPVQAGQRAFRPWR